MEGLDLMGLCGGHLITNQQVRRSVLAGAVSRTDSDIFRTGDKLQSIFRELDRTF